MERAVPGIRADILSQRATICPHAVKVGRAFTAPMLSLACDNVPQPRGPQPAWLAYDLLSANDDRSERPMQRKSRAAAWWKDDESDRDSKGEFILLRIRFYAAAA